MHNHVKFRQLLEALTGQVPPLAHEFCEVAPQFPTNGLGYSQLTEVLLLLGYDRVTQAFFQFLVDGTLVLLCYKLWRVKEFAPPAVS